MTREINAGSHEPTSARQEWRTSRALAALIVARWGIDLDAMAHAHNAIVPRFIGPPGSPGAVATDALACPWSLWGAAIFVNPPFSLLARVVFKAIEAAREGCRVVMLAPDNGDTRWYAALIEAGAVVYRFRGRVQYEGADGVDAKGSAAFPSALYVLHPNPTPRPAGSLVVTYCMDPKTLEVL